VSEAKAIGATIALAGVPAEERMRAAQASLIAAKVLTNYSIYTPEGLDIQHMQGAQADASVLGGSVTAPTPLPEVLRAQARERVVAFSELIRRPDGALFLPLTLRIPDAQGGVYAYAWSAVELAPLSDDIADLSERRFARRDFVSIIDGRKRLIAA